MIIVIPKPPAIVEPVYTPTPGSTYVKATPLQRFVAALIDGIVGYLPALLLVMISRHLGTVGYIIAIGYMLTKDALPETGGYLGGQSIGKKLMGIKVIKEATGTSLLGDYGTAITRQIPLLIPIFGFIDALMVFSADSKRFGDKWANTVVVKVPDSYQAGVKGYSNTGYSNTPSVNTPGSTYSQPQNTNLQSNADRSEYERRKAERTSRINHLVNNSDLSNSENQQELERLRREQNADDLLNP